MELLAEFRARGLGNLGEGPRYRPVLGLDILDDLELARELILVAFACQDFAQGNLDARQLFQEN